MQQKTLYSLSVPAMVLLAGSLFCFQGGEKKPAADKPAQGDGAMDMKKMMEMMPKPGPEHARLMKDVGMWDCKVTTNMPGQPPQESKGTENVTAFGPFWVHSEFKGDMMGTPFTGMGMTGYDPNKKVYVGSWHDTMSPAVMNHEGTFDEKSKTMTFRGESCDMMDPGKTVKMRMTVIYKGDDARTFTMYEDHGDGKEVAGMVIEYTRRKK